MPLLAVKPIGGQTGDGDGIGVAVFFTFFFLTGFFVGFFVGFLVVFVEGVDLTVEVDFVAAGFGEGLAVAVVFGVGVAAYELVETNIVERKIEITNLNFILYST
jgi:high-affinity Fe2+/Pb2+ permease